MPYRVRTIWFFPEKGEWIVPYITCVVGDSQAWISGQYLIGYGSAPSNLLTPKIRKFAKILVYFGLYRHGLLGELHQTFPHDVSLQGHKNFGIKFWGSFPLKLWNQKLTFQLGDFATLVQISPDWNRLSSIGKQNCKLRSLPYMPTKIGELWSTNGENGD